MFKQLAIAAAISATAVTGAQAAPFNVALDGYCNTFALSVTTFQVAGTRSGCGYTVIDGGTATKVTGTKYTIANDTNDGSVLFTWYFTKPTGGKGSWYLYGSDGVTQALYNQGTYTQTIEAAVPQGGKDVTGR
jgi:hypothetical protein